LGAFRCGQAFDEREEQVGDVGRVAGEQLCVDGDPDAVAARCLSSSSLIAAIGCSTSTNCRSGLPNALAWAVAEFVKTDVWMATVGIPRVSSATASRTHPKVHDPQAPTPVTTNSY
jgi:hypothetical protein